MVKWISHLTSDQTFRVRILAEALEIEKDDVVSCCLMRLWFSGRTRPCQGRDGVSITPSRTKLGLKYPNVVVDNMGDTGDKGHGTFRRVREIVR